MSEARTGSQELESQSQEHQLSRRDFLRTAGLAGLGALTVGVAAVNNPHAFEVNRHARRVEGLAEPLTLALLTDFHLGPFLGAADLARWVDASNELAPDLVCITGDLVDQHYRGNLSELVSELARLASRLGVYVVLGNHDRTRYRNLDPFVAALQEAGAALLVNDGVWPRSDLYLAGIDDLRVGRADVPAALAGAGGASGAKVLLSHNPDVIPELPAGIDLVLCGHTHGGQINLPMVGPLVTSSEYGVRYAQGWVEAPMPAFVSRGLGVTSLPLRVMCPAELVLLELTPAS